MGWQCAHAQGRDEVLNSVSPEPEVEDSAPWSDTQEVRVSLSHPYAMRLVFSAIFLGALVIALRVIFNPTTSWPNPTGHALLEICSVLIASGIAYCLWVQYAVSAEQRILLTTVAVSGLMLGGCAHVVTFVSALGSWGAAEKAGLQYYGAWRVAAACLFIAAAGSTAVGSKPYHRRTGLRTLIGSLVLSLLLASAAIILSRYWPRIHEVSPNAAVVYQAVRWASSSILTHILPLAATVAAFMAFARRYMQDEDVFSDSITKCLLLIAIAHVAGIASTGTYDLVWWSSHVFGIAALLVLLVKLATEFGASYANAEARIEHLEAVHYISSRISHTLDLRVVMLVLVSDIANMLSARFASVMLSDETGETLSTVATHGLPESPLKSGHPQKVEGSGRPGFHSGHTARAFREKRVCTVDDVHTDVEFVPWRLLAQSDGYAISVPLVYQDVALGILDLFFDKHVPLNDERIRLFETLASAAAVAIANAQLYDTTLQAQSEGAEAASFLRLKLAS